MTDASWKLQTAVYSAISNSAALKALIGDPVPVFDEIPERQEMPYIEIDEPTSREWDTSSDYGKEHDLSLHIYSAYEGKKELNDIMAALETLFREFAEPIVGHRIVNFRLEFTDRFREPDLQARRGVMRFRVVTEEA